MPAGGKQRRFGTPEPMRIDKKFLPIRSASFLCPAGFPPNSAPNGRGRRWTDGLDLAGRGTAVRC